MHSDFAKIAHPHAEHTTEGTLFIWRKPAKSDPSSLAYP